MKKSRNQSIGIAYLKRDIATYIIVKKGLEKPSTYRQTFEILRKERIIPEKLTHEFSDLAGFRNVLV